MKIKKGKSLCFFSAKGGVGKTTNLLNLAGILEQLGKRVLIVDFDLYSGGISTYLNKKGDKSVYSLSFDMDNNTFTKLNNYVYQVDNYIDVLCAPKDPRCANKVNINNIKSILNNAKLEYDVVLIDTNHALDQINLSILEIVDNILFVTTNDLLDLKNIKSLLNIFKSLEFNNFKLLLNNSRDPFKNYFSKYEIKKIINHNIDYTLSTDLFLKDMDKYAMKGVIVSLDRKFSDIMSDDYNTFVLIATDLLGGNEDE